MALIGKPSFLTEQEGLEVEAQPSIDPGKCKFRDRATCPVSRQVPWRWVANRDIVVLSGPPGAGKTHLEVALGRAAVTQQQGMREARLAQDAKPKRRIVAELGDLPLEPQPVPSVDLPSLRAGERADQLEPLRGGRG